MGSRAVLHAAVRWGSPQVQDHEGGRRFAGVVEAVGEDVTEFAPGDEVFGTSVRLGRVRAASREVRLVTQAGQPVLRGSGRRPDRRDHRPAGRCATRGRSARAEGADQRRVRRRRHLRRADREGVRRGRDRRVQHEERRAGPVARRRPRRSTTPRRTSPGAASATTLMIDIAGSRPFSKFSAC